MKTKTPRPLVQLPVIATLFALALALDASASAFAASTPAPYIETSHMSYQLENQSFNLLASLPPENRFPNLDTGAPNPDYATFTAGFWEVSTDNGANWRAIGSAPEDAALYTSGSGNPLTITSLKTTMTGWQYRVTVDISYNDNDAQSTDTRTTAPVKLNVRPSYVKCPIALTFDDAGNLYVADSLANAIWKITGDTKISLFAGSATGEADATDATGTNARFNAPQGIAWQGGKLYVADFFNNAIRVITPAGAVTTLTGALAQPGDYQEGAAAFARFNGPSALTADASGNLYVADSANNVLRKITPDGSTTHIAGDYYSNGYFSTSATMSLSGGLRMYRNTWTGTDGTVLDIGSVSGAAPFTLNNAATLQVGVVNNLAGSGTLPFYVLNGSNVVTLNGNDLVTSTTLPPGTLLLGGTTSFGLSNLGGIDINTGSLVYVTPSTPLDPGITGSTTLITTSTTPFPSPMLAAPNPTDITTSPDAIDAATFRFAALSGITLSADGKTLYVADTANNQVVTIALADGSVTPLALDAINAVPTDPLAGYTTMNGPSDTALFNVPTDIAIDAAGNLYVADSENAAIRKITLTGTTPTVSTLQLTYDATPAAPADNTTPDPTTSGTTNNTTNNNAGAGGNGGGGGGAPSVLYLLALAALSALRLRRR